MLVVEFDYDPDDARATIERIADVVIPCIKGQAAEITCTLAINEVAEAVVAVARGAR